MSNETTIPALLSKVTYRLHTDDVATFKLITIRVAQAAREQAGCLFFDAAQDLADPTLTHLIEGWASREALAAFSASHKFQVLLQEAMALRILDRSVSVYLVSGAENPPMPS